MKFPKIAFLMAVMVMVLSLFLVGCGSSFGQSPADSLKELFQNLFADNIVDYICKDAGPEGLAALGGLADAKENAKNLGGKIELNIDKMKFETVKEDGNNASVKVWGVMKITLLGQSQDLEFPEGTIPMVKEDGKWKMCGPLK